MGVAVFSRAVKISALIYEINVAAINAIKYFNAVNATLFTSGVFPDTKPPRACSQSAGRDRVEDGESWGIVGWKVSIKEAKWRNNHQNKVVCSICQAEFSDHRSSTFSCVYQSECARMRPVIGLVACHSKCSQPIRGGAQEAGKNSLFCLQLQREAEERTWKYT